MNNSAITENYNSEMYIEEKKQSLDIFEDTNLFKKERASRSKREKMIKNDIKGWLFSMWPFVGYCVFSLFPFVLSIYLSMCDLHVWNIANATWVGFDNFIFLLFSSNSQFLWSLLQTLYYFISLPIGIVLGLGSAVLLTSRIKMKKFFRTTLYIPNVCSTVGVTMMWQVIFDKDAGLINSLLGSTGAGAIDWFNTPSLFMPLVIFTTTWSAGSGSLLFQAALEQVNQSLIEAANIDGAKKSEIFFNVTLPAISPTTFYVLTMNTIGALQAMGTIQLFSQAGTAGTGYGPQYTEGPFAGKFAGMTTVYYVYMMGIGGGSEGQGKSSAAAWLLAVFILAITRLNFKMSDKWVSYDN